MEVVYRQFLSIVNREDIINKPKITDKNHGGNLIMSGHSKWSKVKHQKESTDAAKGKIFTKLTKAIITAVKEGGGVTDPNGNMKLRLAMEKARSANMPKENIERAIERGKGSGDADNLVQAVYEAFGPGGIGMIIEATTDNKQRTVAEVKNLLDRGGGVLAASGAVSYLFTYLGQIDISKGDKSFDQIMDLAIGAGAADIEDSDFEVFVYTKPNDLHKTKEILSQSLLVKNAELTYKPTTRIMIKEAGTARQLMNLVSALEENEDIQKIHINADIPDEFVVE